MTTFIIPTLHWRADFWSFGGGREGTLPVSSDTQRTVYLLPIIVLLFPFHFFLQMYFFFTITIFAAYNHFPFPVCHSHLYTFTFSSLFYLLLLLLLSCSLALAEQSFHSFSVWPYGACLLLSLKLPGEAVCAHTHLHTYVRFPGARTVADPMDYLRPQRFPIPYALDFQCHTGREADNFQFATSPWFAQREGKYPLLNKKQRLTRRTPFALHSFL